MGCDEALDRAVHLRAADSASAASQMTCLPAHVQFAAGVAALAERPWRGTALR